VSINNYDDDAAADDGDDGDGDDTDDNDGGADA
jgi:hypothetical protein